MHKYICVRKFVLIALKGLRNKICADGGGGAKGQHSLFMFYAVGKIAYIQRHGLKGALKLFSFLRKIEIFIYI